MEHTGKMNGRIKATGGWFWAFLLMALISCAGPSSSWSSSVCAVCGKPIYGPIYEMTDQTTGEKVLVCSNCLMTLPRCYICGLPVLKEDAVELPDGRYLCARDAKTVVLDTNQAMQICEQVRDDLDKLFSRYTFFPTNVDIAWIDRLDVEAMSQQSGYDIESPNLLGCIRPVLNHDGEIRYAMRLMTGMTFAGLKATCAHEYSHAWVRDNVLPPRHARIAKDTEEGFCELVAYLLMDSQQEEAQKQFILRNHYTRGQVQLFIEAEQQYGFDEILDWMRYGVTSRLEDGRLDEIRDIQAQSTTPAASGPYSEPIAIRTHVAGAGQIAISGSKPSVEPTQIQLEGIMLGGAPAAVINGRTFFIGDVNILKIGGTNMSIRCLAIQQNQVKIVDTASGRERDLYLQ